MHNVIIFFKNSYYIKILYFYKTLILNTYKILCNSNFCLEIKTASLDDIDSVIDLLKKPATDQLTTDEYFTEDIDFSSFKEQILNYLTNKNTAIFIAYNETSVVGFIKVLLQNKDFYFFEDIFTIK